MSTYIEPKDRDFWYDLLYDLDNLGESKYGPQTRDELVKMQSSRLEAQFEMIKGLLLNHETKKALALLDECLNGRYY